MIRRPPRSTPLYSSAASDVYKRQTYECVMIAGLMNFWIKARLSRLWIEYITSLVLNADERKGLSLPFTLAPKGGFITVVFTCPSMSAMSENTKSISTPSFLAFMFAISSVFGSISVSYTHLRAHETGRNLVCRLLLE